jgi:hypothetical protein
MRRVRIAGIGLAVWLMMLIAGPAPAVAAEWRFCIAPAHQEHKIYITAPFFAVTSMEAMEGAFHLALERSGRRHDSVQCPTGADEPAVRAMRLHADEFNRQMGIEVIPVDWRPAAGH